MLEAEARRLCAILLGQRDVSPLVDLGSSTRAFRRSDQSHIHAHLFGPLEQAGIRIVHCDLKQGEGVDVSGDVTDPAVAAVLKAVQPRCILVANLLEHVKDRARLAAACEEIAGPGGLILATVPSSYPYHADPIDTGYRPTPTALAGIFRRSRLVLAEEVVGPSFGEMLRRQGISPGLELARTLLWALVAFARPKSFAARAHRWLWFRRPTRLSVALVEVR